MEARLPDVQQPLVAPIAIDPSLVPSISDDQCIVCLAQAVAEHDESKLAQVASLISRLAVVIE